MYLKFSRSLFSIFSQPTFYNLTRHSPRADPIAGNARLWPVAAFETASCPRDEKLNEDNTFHLHVNQPLAIAIVVGSAPSRIYGSMPNINNGTGGLFRPCLITL